MATVSCQAGPAATVGSVPTSALAGPSGGSRPSALPLTNPPPEVPAAHLVLDHLRQTGRLLAFRWRDSRGVVAQQDPGDIVTWPPVVAAQLYKQTEIELQTAVSPVRVELRSYATVDPLSGAPRTETMPVICQVAPNPSAPCVVSLKQGRLHITVPTGTLPFLVLYAEWYVPTAVRTDANVPSYSGSWGFHL